MSQPYGRRKPAFGGRGGNNNGRGGGGGRGSDGFSYNNGGNSGGAGRNRAGRQAGGGSRPGGDRGGPRQHQQQQGGGGGGPNASASVMRTLLKLVFEKSGGAVFVEESGMLNLSNMRASPDLADIQRSVDFNSVTFCKAIAEVIKEKFQNRVRVLNLDNNDIGKLSAFLFALRDADLHHSITAISACSNRIADLSFISVIKPFDSLVELLLLNNPVTTTANYTSQISRQLPLVKMLDTQPLIRGLLSLPNPAPAPAFQPLQLSILQFLEQSVFHAMQSRQVEQCEASYHPQYSVFSVSKFAEPIPSRVPFDAVHNSSDLSKPMRNNMVHDLAQIRSAIQWRNIIRDIHSVRNLATKPRAIGHALRSVIGGTKPVVFQQVLNANANVVFLEANMKVPVCVLTVHGKITYSWNPPNSGFIEGRAPFISCFFDRTMSLTYDATTGTWSIANDMLNMRPDRSVVHDDGSLSEALFFANTAPRIEKMRRRLMPNMPTEAMQSLVQRFLSDRDVQTAAERVCAMPPEQQAQVVAGDVNAMFQGIGI